MACVWTLDVVPFPFSHHLSAVRCCAVYRFSLSILSCIIQNTGLLSPHTSSYRYHPQFHLTECVPSRPNYKTPWLTPAFISGVPVTLPLAQKFCPVSNIGDYATGWRPRVPVIVAFCVSFKGTTARAVHANNPFVPAIHGHQHLPKPCPRSTLVFIPGAPRDIFSPT